MVREAPVVLSGYGPVGVEYAALLRTHGHEWGRRYGVRPRLVAVRGQHAATEVVADGRVPERARWTARDELAAVLAATGAEVLVQAVPSHADGVTAATRDALTALERGAHVVTATKSHLLAHWHRLRASAESAGRAMRISGATGAAMPAGDLVRSVLRGFDVVEVRGCLNGTATFVLDELARGAALAEAVAHARERGIAEADPTADLSGTDAATKLRLLTGLLWDWDVPGVEVRTEPIDKGTARRARHVAEDGHRLRQVVHARVDRPDHVRVELRREPVDGALGGVRGPDKALLLDCADAGELLVSGGRSSPRGAARAMVKDTLGCLTEATTGFG